jgi:hypothetical protein
MSPRSCAFPLFLLLPSLAGGAAARAHRLVRGAEIRPVAGVTSNLYGIPVAGQLQLGLEGTIPRRGNLGIVLGGWAGFAENFAGASLHAGVKYRFTDLSPIVFPFVEGGGAVNLGFPRGSRAREDVISGIGLRFGGGFEVLASPKVLPGLRIIFDVGPRLTPNVGILATAQVVVGCTFVL